MIAALRHLLGWLLSTLRSREDLILENLALRQQLLVLRSQRPRRRLATAHKLFWIALRGVWSGWKKPLVMVTPRTVVAWHRAGFRLYWRWLSRAKQVGGRKPVSKELRGLILRMAMENPTWGAPRIHGELLKVGLDVSERTVARYLRPRSRRGDAAKRWASFLAFALVGSCLINVGYSAAQLAIGRAVRIDSIAPTSPIGLPRIGEVAGGRDTQSSAFLSPPGML